MKGTPVKRLAIVVLVAAMLVLPLTLAAQESIRPPAPDDWGGLAERLAELWAIPVNPQPSGGSAAINALNLIGVGKKFYDAIMSIEGESFLPDNEDGYNPDNWLPEQELTQDFLCMLKMLIWAAVFNGLIPYYEVPPASTPDYQRTPEEDEIAKTVAGQAVLDMVDLAQRDAECEFPPPRSRCYRCVYVIPYTICWWEDC